MAPCGACRSASLARGIFLRLAVELRKNIGQVLHFLIEVSVLLAWSQIHLLLFAF